MLMKVAGGQDMEQYADYCLVTGKWVVYLLGLPSERRLYSIIMMIAFGDRK
jgi:hypothetical protein